MCARFDAVFIDFYGTLAAGDRQAVEDTCAVIVADYGLAMTAADMARLWGDRFFALADRSNQDRFLNLYDCEMVSLRQTLAPLVGAVDPTPYCERLKRYWASPDLHDDSLDLLAELDVPVCCVSNADTEDLLSAVALHGLRFDAVITSEDARCYKPHERIFRDALDRMGADPRRTIHIGDSLHSDVGGAGRLGITTVWICRERRIYDVGRAQADHTIQSLKELRRVLAS
ncbi:MAG TPA: HAD family hydrolase [Phycisphaerae bacterium]|jgi:2-haloacid dehalogenase/putative hydrolase of the HAD superfamily